MIDVFTTFQASAGNIGGELLGGAVQFTLRSCGIRDAAVSVVVVDDETMRGVNRTYLKHDYSTDVITFPLEESPLEAELYLCVDAARRQSREYGVTVTEEIVRLAVHGALHAAGFDDRSESDRLRMLTEQERCVSDFLRSHRKNR